MKLTKAQRFMLELACDLGGTIRIFPDQFSTATVLETMGYLTGNGRYFSRSATITPAGRSALQREGE